jgi:hypothetical protein
VNPRSNKGREILFGENCTLLVSWENIAFEQKLEQAVLHDCGLSKVL